MTLKKPPKNCKVTLIFIVAVNRQCQTMDYVENYSQHITEAIY